MNTHLCNNRTDAPVRWWQHGATVFGTACVIWFFSEMFFWNEGEHFYFWSNRSTLGSLAASLGEWALVFLLFYSFFALWLLVPISVFRVRNIWSLVLAGAICGWAIEGSVMPIMYAELWGGLLWPAASWHVVVNVLFGWWWLRRALEEYSAPALTAIFVVMGAAWSIWATWLWPTDGSGGAVDVIAPMTPQDFFLLAFISTGILAFGYWLLDRFSPERFVTSRSALMALTLVAVLLSVVGSRSFVLILAVLVGLTSLVLWRNRTMETAPNILSRFAHTIRSRNYFLLFLMPLVASSLYPIWYARGISVNEHIAGILYPIIVSSVVLIAGSVAKILFTQAGVVASRRRSE